MVKTALGGELPAPVVLGRVAGAWRLAALALDPVNALDLYFAPVGRAIEITRTGKGPRRLMFMYDPEYNRRFLLNTKAMQTSGLWPLSARPGSAQTILRAHPLKTSGAEHANFNTLIDPYFDRTAVNARYGDIRAQIVAQVEQWQGGVHDIYQLARRCTESVSFSLLFGAEESARFAAFGDLLHDYHRAVWTRSAQGFPFDLPGTPYRRALRRADAVLAFAYAWMQEAAPDGSVLSRLASATDASGCPYSNQKIAAATAMISWLSYETMATALSWAVMLLGLHPAILADLVDELSAQAAVEDIDHNALMALPVLDAVIKEAMRLITPVPLVSFRMAEDGEIAGEWFARGSRFYVAPHLTHRLPELYPAPDRFRPGRWSTIRPSAYEYMPFGAGQRRCPGAALATVTLKLTLAAMLSRFHISSPAGARYERMYAVVTMPRNTIPIELTPRGQPAPARRDGSQSGSIFDLFTPEPGRAVGG